MHFHISTFALFSIHSSIILAQQACYWPDGSGVRPGQGPWVNCYSSQDSVCCHQGEVCLSNGLCYGSEINQVSLSYNIPSSLPWNKALTPKKRHIEADALSKTGVIQLHVRISGATTVRTLSTASVGSSFSHRTSSQEMMIAANAFFLR